MVHIVLPIQFKKRYAPYLLIGQTEMMQIVYLLHIGEVFHQEELEIRRNCTGIYLREDAVLPQRCTDLFLVQRVENGKSIYGIDANCCKERIQKAHARQNLERDCLFLCCRTQELHRTLRNVRAAGNEIEQISGTDTRTKIGDNRRIQRLKVRRLLIESVIRLIVNVRSIQCFCTRVDMRTQDNLLRLFNPRSNDSYSCCSPVISCTISSTVSNTFWLSRADKRIR